MKQKVLIFGLGRQGYKYYQYFSDLGYNIIGVTQNGISELGVQEIYSFQQLLAKDISFYEDISYIIVCVFPISEQEKVIEHLLQLHVLNKCIIEKPVCYNPVLFQKLIERENYTFFVDEIVLAKTFQKLFPDMQNVIFELSSSQREDERKHILQHMFGGFLLFDTLQFSQDSIVDSDDLESEYTHFRIGNESYTLLFHKSDIYLDEKHIGELQFAQKVEGVIDILSQQGKNMKYKQNFYTLLVYLEIL